MKASRPEVALVGAGGLAQALARALARSGGVSLTVASRRPAEAARAVRGLGGARAVPTIAEAIAGAEIVILAVPDRAIASVARACARKRSSWHGVVVLHAAGVLHPLAVLGAGGFAAIDGAFARIEGTPAARAAARRLCSLAGLTPLRGAGLSSPAGRKR
jgi:saccharopine dehydrogenase-like NADP-dependent oxidoreductase